MINIFEKFSRILYIHIGEIDNGNRLIPESQFYNCTLKVLFLKPDIKDSVYYRYNDNYMRLWLKEDDLILQHLIYKKLGEA